VLASPAFAGDTLLLSALADERDAAPDPDPAAHERMEVPVQVTSFGASHLAARLDVGTAQGAWLLYSDTWNPGWRARVNGKSVEVRNAALAYKAVPLEPGTNDVDFRFAIPWMRPLRWVVAVWALAWHVGVVFLLVRRHRQPSLLH
jgi:hypothetical protein